MRAERIKSIGPIERGEHVDRYTEKAKAAAVGRSPRVTYDRGELTVVRRGKETTTYVEVRTRNGRGHVASPS